MPDFQIKTQTLQNNIVMIKVKGFLDAHTYEELEKTISEFFERNLYKFVVDLSELGYISSAGAGVFIGAIGTAQENNGNIVILNPSNNVKEVLELLGLTQIFTISQELESAIKTFQQ
ncbi:MAG: STAS domain-containing protein [Planctomycetes bacterium]|nr:STAS domain-containing protein [Planctomycetota bacterium]